MNKEKLLEKARRRVREADIDGEPVLVKVYPECDLKRMLGQIREADDRQIAQILSEQFITNDGDKIFTPEFFLSDECTQCFVSELAQLFIEVNQGIYKKKLTANR